MTNLIPNTDQEQMLFAETRFTNLQTRILLETTTCMEGSTAVEPLNLMRRMFILQYWVSRRAYAKSSSISISQLQW